MYQYKRLLVCLDLSEKDTTVLAYASMISKMARSEKVYFIHIEDSLNIPDGIKDAYPDIVQPVDETGEKIMRELVQKHFEGPPGIETSCEVVEGQRLIELLRLAKQKLIDLMMVGRKKDGDGNSGLTEKLAQKSPCSILILPHTAVPRIKKILVPVDFSGHSADALEVGVQFAKGAGIPELECISAYHVPTGYHKTGKTYEEFAEVMKEQSMKEFDEFIGKVDLQGVKADPKYYLAERASQAILKAADEENVDLIIMGAHGRSTTAAVLLGSVTERVISFAKRPILAVKKKGAGQSLLDALLESY